MVRERLRPIEENPVSKLIQSTYTSILERSLRFLKIILCLPLLFLSLGLVSWDRLKTDDWIALDEGSFFYMPTLYPAVSFSQAMQVLQTQDQLISQIPEVKNVLGKIGRADTALDPAPTSMIETYVMLKPKSQWREGMDKQSIWSEILQRATLPGVTPASLLQPIEGRVVMLQSGIKANMAIRIYGDDLKKLARVTRDIAAHLKHLDSVNPLTVNPDIVLGKPYVEFTVDRKGASRYGLSVDSINQVIAAGLGGQSVTMTYEGRERYAVQVRYQRDYLEDVKKLGATPIVTNSGQKIPLRAVAKLQTLWGPAAISSENARLVAHVSFSPSATKGPVETVDSVMQSLLDSQKSGKLNLPTGYELEPVGSFQSQLETNRTLYWVIPLVVAINLVILYLMFKSWIISLLMLSGIPLAFGGGMLLLALLGIELNTAVWIGFIALFGIAVDNGVILASYTERRLRASPPANKTELKTLIFEAALQRIRPCIMTTATTIFALTPVLLSTGKGAELARSMALPIFGGMFSALLLLLVFPTAYYQLRQLRSETSQ